MKKNTKKYKLINFLLVITSIFSISLFLLIFNLSVTTKKEFNKFDENTTNIHRLSDTYFNEDEYNFVNTSQAFDQLALLSEYLEKNTNFDYIIDGRQYISTEDLPPNLSVGSYENIPEYLEVFDSLQVNSSFFKLSGINLYNNNIFTVEDYIYKENISLPVIIGSSFSEELSLNEELIFYWNGKKFNGFVSDILTPGSYYNDGMDIRILDSTVIIPSLELNSIDKNEEFFQLLAFDKVNGLVNSSKSPKLIQNTINQYANNIELKNFELSNTNSIQLNLWGLEGKNLVNLMSKISVIILITSIFCISVNLIIQLTFMSKTISIYLVNGYSLFRIFSHFSIYILVLNLASIIVGSIISYIFLGYQNNKLNLLLLSFTLFIEMSLILIKLKKIDIAKEIRK
ncbi:ABC transporter permease family protein [Vagococcus fluvialis]|uniref:hypothetical protein n=1 Tax=Vagococcus fluvialis TaxID=2738 RepID=UPI001D0B959F|nr:hypothetical protein [Vagococcus fluvialis]UDM81172.1 hypothetical protein K5K97_14045 [Vagococcus fluvialis]